MSFYQKLIKYIKIYAFLNLVCIGFSYIAINAYLGESSEIPQIKIHQVNHQVTNTKSPQHFFSLAESGAFFSSSSSSSFENQLHNSSANITYFVSSIKKYITNQYTNSPYKFSHLIVDLVRGPPLRV